MTPQDYILAARCPASLRPQEFGLWRITRKKLDGVGAFLAGFRSETILWRYTESTMHVGGEIVMEDTIVELRRHLPIWLAAHGRVLVSGLGLGCVVRGLLASAAVEHVDVVEIDPGILLAVGPEFSGDRRVTLHQGDALYIDWPAQTRWDFGWHDCWSDQDAGEPHLQTLHTKLLGRYERTCAVQGAWMLPRFVKRLARLQIPLIG